MDKSECVRQDWLITTFIDSVRRHIVYTVSGDSASTYASSVYMSLGERGKQGEKGEAGVLDRSRVQWHPLRGP